jgi:membrane associated rhomboid family serine protease
MQVWTLEDLSEDEDAISPLSSTMLHGLVYFINMLALWFVGAAIEMKFTVAAIISTISAVGARLGVLSFFPEYITMVSGGIFGFIGLASLTFVMN